MKHKNRIPKLNKLKSVSIELESKFFDVVYAERQVTAVH